MSGNGIRPSKIRPECSFNPKKSSYKILWNLVRFWFWEKKQKLKMDKMEEISAKKWNSKYDWWPEMAFGRPKFGWVPFCVKKSKKMSTLNSTFSVFFSISFLVSLTFRVAPFHFFLKSIFFPIFLCVQIKGNWPQEVGVAETQWRTF